MATINRRHLVSRTRNDASSPAQTSHSRNSVAPARERETIQLPNYEPPSFPLTAASKRKLEELQNQHTYHKYKTHIGSCITVITEATAEVHDRLTTRKAEVAKAREKRSSQGVDDEDISRRDAQAEQFAAVMAKKVDGLTMNGEKALRELIDWGDELSVHENILREVLDGVGTAPAVQAPNRRRRAMRNAGEDSDEEDDMPEEEAPVQDVEVLSAVELLKEARTEHLNKWTAKSMRLRYGEDNAYRNFKRTIHDAQHPGDDGPPLAHARTWFPEENEGDSRRTRQQHDEDSDDEVVIASVSKDLKCPFTLKYFVVPFSNPICPHTFEKSAIEDYAKTESRDYRDGQGPRFKCPQSGCEKLLNIHNFTINQLLLRQVKRALKQSTQDNDDEPSQLAPPGSRREPENLEDSDEDNINPQARRRATIQKVKRERLQSQGLGGTPSRRTDPDEDEEDEDEVMEM